MIRADFFRFIFLDQLMSKSIQVKQPELETKRIALLQNESDFLKKREELQEKLLLELSKSQGDILKNEVNMLFNSTIHILDAYCMNPCVP